jgi:hypothetical protein
MYGEDEIGQRSLRHPTVAIWKYGVIKGLGRWMILSTVSSKFPWCRIDGFRAQRMFVPGCYPCSSRSQAKPSLPRFEPLKDQVPGGFEQQAWSFKSGTIREISLQMMHPLRSLRVGRFSLQAFPTANSCTYPNDAAEGSCPVRLSLCAGTSIKPFVSASSRTTIDKVLACQTYMAARGG